MRPRSAPRGGDSSAHHRREARDAHRQSAHPRWQAPLTAALPGGRRLVPPGPSGRGRELPLGFEPVVPIGADGLAPRQPEVVGVERDRLGGGTPAFSPGAEGRRNATRLDRLRLGTARRRGPGTSQIAAFLCSKSRVGSCRRSANCSVKWFASWHCGLRKRTSPWSNGDHEMLWVSLSIWEQNNCQSTLSWSSPIAPNRRGSWTSHLSAS